MLQTTVARACNITDGCNGRMVLPANPATGQPVHAPVVMRFTPCAHLADTDIAGVLFPLYDGRCNRLW